MDEAFRQGQRWISTSEPELGLGSVRAVGGRRVTLSFPATGETREYAVATAPLRRVAYRPGDTIRTTDHREARVDDVVEHDGLLHYRTTAGEIAETALAHTLSFASPTERLFAGAFDTPQLFDLRLAALGHEHRRRQSAVRGFVGARIDLLPHQFSIAAEVTRRLVPRVLLADEVGLGKTIEACLIVHRLLLTGRAQRVLIVVPETLVHQWFLELLRRFNLWCHVYDEGRCLAIEEATPEANPFLEHQLIVVTIDLFTRSERRLSQALAAGWDLVVVDEAHHLVWSPEHTSPEYAAIEALGRQSPGLLLLTATPEQLGIAGHFARLRLLDPDRFFDLEAFREESDTYLDIARIAEKLRLRRPLTPTETSTLAPLVGVSAADIAGAMMSEDGAVDRWIETLLDRHGTGRVMFRNTRATVSGFPQRLPSLHHLSIAGTDGPRLKALAAEWAADTDRDADTAFTPHYARDPRIDWLLTLLRATGPDKLLLICRSQRKAMAIEAALKQHTTLPAGTFHEGLTLVQRDRAAAWFAEPDGARLLICSEIGSEGRNFQFAHHLVLFDLPLDPALLEQRIGRLDRIGQREDVRIHVPSIAGTHLEVLARWYHDGLDAFARNVAGGRELGEQHRAALERLIGLAHKRKPIDGELNAFIAAARASRDAVAVRLEQGRDRLLEWNSFRPEIAARTVDGVRTLDGDRSLDEFMLSIFDTYFIEVEELAPRTYRLGSAGVLVDEFPGLSADGLTMTADRARALAREELQFLTWDHPLATGALDLLLGSEHGNCAFARWTDASTSALYVETLFVLECVAPPAIQADRFLPPTPIRVLIDHRGQRPPIEITEPSLKGVLKKGDGRSLLSRADIRDRVLPHALDRARVAAESVSADLIERARQEMQVALQSEADRLRALQMINPSVRQDEIALLGQQQRELDRHLGQARIRLDAIRLIHRGPDARAADKINSYVRSDGR